MGTRLDSLLTFLEKDPDDSFTRYAVGLEYLKNGDDEAGERYLRETIERDADYLPAYHQLGQFYGRSGRMDDAEQIYSTGISVAARLGEHHTKSEMEQELEELQEEM